MILDQVIKGAETHPRSFLKAVTWRMLGSVDTFMLSYFFTGRAGVAGAIASTEVVTKIILYYFHERVWSMSEWGHRPLHEDAGADGARATVEETTPAKPGA